MGKYDPLQDYLSEADEDVVPMGFSEIETVLGFELPPSSHTQRAWWSNNPTNNVMTRAWIEAGYETMNVDLTGKKLVFKKTGIAPAVRVAKSGAKRSPLFGALKGMVTVMPGTDLTQPADPEWADRLDE